LIETALPAMLCLHVLLWKDKFRVAALHTCIILADFLWVRYHFGGLTQTNPQEWLNTAVFGDFSFCKFKPKASRNLVCPMFDPYGKFYRKTAGSFPGSADCIFDG
jgi:hypothetical protein